jgi:hypothetical protein
MCHDTNAACVSIALSLCLNQKYTPMVQTVVQTKITIQARSLNALRRICVAKQESDCPVSGVFECTAQNLRC